MREGTFIGIKNRIRCPWIIQMSKVVQQFTYFRLYVWYIVLHAVIVPFCLIGFIYQNCRWSKCSLWSVIRTCYFQCINTAARVRFLCNGCIFFMSCGSRRLFCVGLIVISLTAISIITRYQYGAVQFWNYNNAMRFATPNLWCYFP